MRSLLSALALLAVNVGAAAFVIGALEWADERRDQRRVKRRVGHLTTYTKGGRS